MAPRKQHQLSRFKKLQYCYGIIWKSRNELIFKGSNPSPLGLNFRSVLENTPLNGLFHEALFKIDMIEGIAIVQNSNGFQLLFIQSFDQASILTLRIILLTLKSHNITSCKLMDIDKNGPTLYLDTPKQDGNFNQRLKTSGISFSLSPFDRNQRAITSYGEK
ncbi:hypothetical protein GOBAR_DD36304 [Gossypium barbadense]|nr:hypothetical protein GOBAR_DD36304 [Gossypium barbadense]